MPKVDHQAVLEIDEVRTVMDVARKRGSLTFALAAWCYEFGARAAEPGLQLFKDVDVRLNRARPAHLKGGARQVWHPLLPFCREALPRWLEEWKRRWWVGKATGRELFLFPTDGNTGRCYTCKGTGARPILKRDGERRFRDGTTDKCHHCNGTGQHWGITRFEVYDHLSGVLRRAGIPAGRRHPHVLRHSIITHLLDAGVPAATVQDRVGHRLLSTTLGYARTTQAALAEMEGRMAHLYERNFR
jgi:integrase